MTFHRSPPAEQVHTPAVAAPRRRATVLLTPAAGALLLIAASLAAAAPALATPGPSHALTSTFGSATSAVTDPYPLSHPADAAVDERPGPQQGDLYVADTGNHRIEKFTPTGEFILMFGQEVDATTKGNVCTAASLDICQPGVESSSPPGLLTPTYLAVDNAPGGEGDVYVADNGDGLLSKFDPSGHLVSSWGVSGQKNGSDIVANTSPVFGTFTGITVGPKGNLYVGAQPEYGLVFTYTQNGTFFSPNALGYLGGENPNSTALKLFNGELYGYNRSGPNQAIIRRPSSGRNSQEEVKTVTASGVADTGFGLDPLDGEIYQDTGTSIAHYSPACDPLEGLCEPIDFFGESDLSGAKGVAVFGTASNSRTVYVADAEANDIAVFSDIRPTSVASPPIEVTETSLTLTGHVDLAPNHPEGHPEIVECRFEYGFKKSYGNSLPCEPKPETTPFTSSTTEVRAKVSGLTPITYLPVGTRYHYRVVATSAEGGTGFSADHTAQTTAPPQFEGVSASHVTATSAQLEATVATNGLPTRYHFEYGLTTEYGQRTPIVEITGNAAELFESRAVKATIENLQRGATYHFLLVAENALDEGSPAISEDHTFEFFPPSCPNSAVRQQTGSAYLPDCRAYELVSSANANGTLLFPGGPTSPTASPSRLAYTGAFSALPEARETIGTNGDLYVATRTNGGWVSHYIGLPGDTTGCMGGPPTNPESHTTHAEKIHDWVLTDSLMSRFLNFDLGPGSNCYLSGNGTSDATQELDLASNAGYLWNADGKLLAHLPSNLESTPGAAAALACPDVPGIGHYQFCHGEVSASGDLSHVVFSSNNLSFAEPGQPAGLTEAPGSAYDDNLATGEITLISKLAGGGDIPQDPTYAGSSFFCSNTEAAGRPLCPNSEFIRFPAISTDGSHILMSTATASTPFCDRANSQGSCPRFTDTPLHLYMSVEDGPAVEISKSEVSNEGVAVTYVGSTPDLARVFFTSEEHLTSENPGHGGASLYMWTEKGEEEGHPLTLISKAAPGSPPGAGDTASCTPASTEQYGRHIFQPIGEAPWTKECGVVPYSGWSYANAFGSTGGNGHSDSAIASANGDIYFYSPELLDGNRGVPDQQNLYVYREGAVQFVASFPPTRFCQQEAFGERVCADGPVARLEVTPHDTHIAFVTAARLTSYDNAGHLEMYSYTPSTRALVCDSCNPNGRPATADVLASQNGLFQTEDGRTFFSTTEALVPTDTNRGEDVYEFVNGRPRLITPGTGTATLTGLTLVSLEEQPGLIGVSADGTDVYFSTYDVLLTEDHNGNFLKFYDARTSGGFLQPPPVQPCAAAEECHGPGTEAPQIGAQGTAATLTGGNVVSGSQRKHHKRPRRHKGHHRRAAHHSDGGAR